MTVNSLIITGNPKLTSIRITAPKDFSGTGIQIAGNDNLKRINLNVTYIQLTTKFLISNNVKLTSVAVPDILIIERLLAIIENDALTSFNLTHLKYLYTDYCLFRFFILLYFFKVSITKNDNLEHIYFPNMAAFIIGNLAVVKNRKLKTIREISNLYNTILFIRGNPSLEEDNLQKLKNLKNKNSNIQRLGGIFSHF